MSDVENSRFENPSHMTQLNIPLHTLELLPQQIVALIKKGDKGRILQLIKHYNIKNVASLRTSGAFDE